MVAKEPRWKSDRDVYDLAMMLTIIAASLMLLYTWGILSICFPSESVDPIIKEFPYNENPKVWEIETAERS